MAQDGKVVWAIVFTAPCSGTLWVAAPPLGAALIFTKGNVEHPVEAVFNVPVVTCHRDDLMGKDGKRSQIIACIALKKGGGAFETIGGVLLDHRHGGNHTTYHVLNTV